MKMFLLLTDSSPKKKSVLQGASDDESAPNTYDYKDTFIDDSGLPSGEAASSDDDSDGDSEPDFERNSKKLPSKAKHSSK